MTQRINTPRQTAHKAWAATLAAFFVGGLTAILARWGLHLGPEEAAALTVLLSSVASGAAAYIKRNYLR